LRLGIKGFLEEGGFEMGKLKSLEEISSGYGMIVIDTCAFHEILRPNSNLKSTEEKLKHYLIKKECLRFWKENVGFYDNCYTTSEVIKEMREVRHYSYKDAIKGDYFMKKKPYLLQLRRTIKDLNKERNRLATYIEDKEKILKLNRDEDYLYDIFYEKYFELKDDYALFDVDFDLLISGAVTSQTRESSAILSNDFGIVRAWSSFLEAEKLSKEKFGFFVRKSIALFEKL